MPDFVDIEFLRLRVGLDENDSSRDVELEMAMDTALAIVEVYLDRKLVLMADSQVFFVNDASILVRRWPIEHGSAVISWSGSGDFDNPDNSVAPDPTYVDHERGIVNVGRVGVGFPLTLAWTGGFDVLPADLLWALMVAFDQVWATTPGFGSASGSASGGAIKKISLVGIGAVEMDSGVSSGASGSTGTDSAPWGILPISATTILDRYRRESVIGVG